MVSTFKINEPVSIFRIYGLKILLENHNKEDIEQVLSSIGISEECKDKNIVKIMFHYSYMCKEDNARKLVLYDENNNVVDIDSKNIDIDGLDNIIDEIGDNIDISKFPATLDFETPFTLYIYPKNCKPVYFNCKYGKCTISDGFYGNYY